MAQKQSFKETTADGSAKDQRISPVLENGDTINSTSQTDPPKLPQYSYTRSQLIEISTSSLSKLRPSCLDPIYNNASGMWDPERWFLGKRRSESPIEEPKQKRIDTDRDLGNRIANKRRPSDPKERLRDEQDDIVLSPQRRSFGTGCHVSQQTAASRRPESPADSRSNESYRDPGRRIGSGRIISRDRDGRGQEFGFRTNDRRDRDRLERDEREMRFGNRSSGFGERKGGRGRQHRIEEEEEPEWFSGGPTSQSETIELHGFEDIPEEEHEEKMDVDKEESSEPKGKRRRRSSNWRKNKAMTDESDIPEEDEREGDEEKENGKNINNKPVDNVPTTKETTKTVEKSSQEFDLNKMFDFDPMPGMFQQNGTLPEPWSATGANAGSSGSRFSQFFRVESPVGGSTSGSRRSSLQEELGNLLNGSGNEPYFTPIAPAQDENCGKHIMDLLQQNSKCENYSDDNKFKNNNLQELTMSGQACNVQELEAGLKELVLGSRRNSESTSQPNGPIEQTSDEMPAFKKLLAQFSEGQDVGDKNRVSQDEARIKMGKVQISGAPVSNAMRDSPMRFNASNANLLNILKNAPTEQDILAGHAKAQVINQQPNTPNQSAPYPDFLARLFQHQQQQNQENPLSKLMASQKGINSLGKRETQQNYHSGIVNGQLNRPSSDLSGKMSQQQQREILASIVKQQQQQQHQLHQAAAAVAAMQQPAIIQQPASPPTSLLRPISPRPSSPQSGIYQQPPRIPSPLVFGQTPPLLSHAPSPIHPTQMMPNMAPIIPMNSNTLQVYNPSMIQRGPSPQELVLHTQQIMQNALIKSKLEEQKEKFRKRQELQRTRSPNVTSMSGAESSPSKISGLSSTMAAFTPTSVMRKMQAEKDKEMGKGEPITANSLFKPQVSASGDKVTLQGKSQMDNIELEKVPRPLHGQGIMHTQLPNRGTTGQNCGRPIVKGSQGLDSLMPKTIQQTNLSGAQNKNFPTNFDINKFLEQQRLMQSTGRQMNTTSSINQPRANYALHPTPRAPAVIHPNVSHSSLNMAPTNVLRNVVHPSVNAAALRAQLNQLALLQQCNLDSQQQMPGPRYIQPVTLHHLLRGQPPMARSQPSSNLNLHGSMGVTKADSQVFSNLSTASANNNSLSTGGLASANNSQSSPVNSNLAKWFGNDILQQKLPDLPPVPTQKALSLEEVERHQQQKTAVHN